ncbi:MAG: hypothetical protein F6K50_01695 [Moorea sp. SIO3I7]|nr:hypothetical protein [Moorena sp. SIO3I7]NEO61049.1 hypothetical protein [Moorena sp. SIO4G2]
MRYLRCVRVQPSAVSRELKAHAARTADLTQIKRMLTSFIQNAFLINKRAHSP